MTLSLTALSVVDLIVTISKLHQTQESSVLTECNILLLLCCWVSLSRTSLCRMSLCWMSISWVSLRRTLQNKSEEWIWLDGAALFDSLHKFHWHLVRVISIYFSDIFSLAWLLFRWHLLKWQIYFNFQAAFVHLTFVPFAFLLYV